MTSIYQKFAVASLRLQMTTIKKTLFKSFLAFASTTTLVIPVFSPKLALSQNIPPDNKFEVRLRTFIPSRAVYAAPAPPLDINCRTSFTLCLYSGDNRAFSPNIGTHRTLQNVIVRAAGAGNPIIGVPTRNFCATNQYNPSQGNAVAGQPSWWWTLRPNQLPIRSRRLPLTNTNNIVRAERVNANTVKVQLVLAAGNPFAGPEIDANINVFIRKNAGAQPEYRVEGNHDGFPAYELYINGTRVYDFDPKTRNQDPASLFPPAEWSIRETKPLLNNWQRVPRNFFQPPLNVCR
jgi:hypothetical protein